MSGLMFHAPTGGFVIAPDALKRASFSIRYAMKKARELGGFPLEPHKREGAMTDACFLEAALIDLARDIGIDIGARQRGQLDLREEP